MGKRYYCDYCDKSFADNPTSRKTHLQGVTHARCRKAHYDSCKDEGTLLREDAGKRPCKTFLSSGECRFGDRCQFSHLTNEDRSRLTEALRVRQEKRKAKLEKESKEKKTESLKLLVDSWCKKREERLMDLKPEEEKKPCDLIPDYILPDTLKTFTNLPPSMLPPSREAILNSSFPEWG